MINSDYNHELLVKKMTPRLSFDKNADFGAWKEQIREKFYELSGLDSIAENACESKITVESREEIEDGTLTLVRFTFDSEAGATVPCYAVIPHLGKDKYPVAITLQGHSSGMYNSVGIIKSEKDTGYQPRGAFALQAAREGYFALAIEQRAMGERKPSKDNRQKNEMCKYDAGVALAIGRTLIAERVWDISRAIDYISFFPEADTDKIIITGNSGGGTASYYAAACDERIKICAPSCAFCPYPESILDIHHCICNYIPFSYKYFDMQDLACLIAPRRLAIIAGEKDPIFPINGVNRGFETVKDIYAAVGAPENCTLNPTPREHWWCVDVVWPTIRREAEKLGWL